MSENVIVKYSDLFEDDGGFIKIKDDFIKLGENLKAEAEKIKKEIGSINLLDNPNMVSAYEERTKKIVDLSAQHKKAIKDLDTAIQEHNKEIANQNKLARDEANTRRAQNSELASEQVARKKTADAVVAENKAKASGIAITKADASARKEDFNAISAENRAKTTAINLSIAEQREKKFTESLIHKEIDAYGQLSNELRVLFRETASIGAQMYKLKKAGNENTKEYRTLAQTFDKLQVEVIQTDKALKDIDASLGRHQRKVGQYENQWNGLGNSINQITREFPAFTFSFQTGLLALSNNIPILADEIVNLRNKNRELVAQGKPVKSMFSTILSSVLSWQTALSIGVTLITVYGGELYNLSKEIFGVQKALEDAENAQISFNRSMYEGTANARNRIAEVQRLIQISTNGDLSEAKRLEAINQLRSKSGGLLANLTDEQIKNNKSLTQYSALYKAIINDERYRSANTEVEDTRKRIELINSEIDAQVKYQTTIRKLRSSISEYSKSNQLNKVADPEGFKKRVEAEIKEARRLEAIRIKVRDQNEDETLSNKDLVAMYKEKAQLQKENEERGKQILKFQEESIDLYIKEEKTRAKVDRKIKEQTASVDYLASKYALEKLQLEGIIKLNEDIADNEKYTADERIYAMDKVMEESKRLYTMERDEALRILKEKYDKEKKETIVGGESRKLMLKYNTQGLLELEKQYYYDSETINEQYNQNIENTNKKYEQKSTLDRLEMDKENLENRRKFFANSASDYEYYSVLISEINQKIEDIINGGESQNVKDGLLISKNELQAVRDQNAELDKILQGRSYDSLTPKQKKKALAEIQKFQRERERLERNYDVMRTNNRIVQIEKEQQSYAEGTTERLKLEKEKNDLLLKLEKDRMNATLNLNKDEVKNSENFLKELNDLIGQIIDRFSEVARKRVEDSEKLLEKQNDAVERQRERASSGLENTLAFEQKMLAQREADLIKQQRRQERLEKIKAIWTSYSNYANQDPQTAVQKALRDFALLEAITMSFGDGGVVEDRLPGNGIFRGQSHQGNRGGIPIMVEGKEGILSKDEMSNLGKDNFYSLKRMAGMGKIDKDLFTRQRKDFDKAMFVPVSVGNDKIAKELRGVQDAILNQPTAVMKQIEAVDGVLKYVIQETAKNKTKNYITITKRPRL